MPDESGPPDPVTVLAAGAAQLHELFLAYITAGFTRPEALALVSVPLAAAAQANLHGTGGEAGDG